MHRTIGARANRRADAPWIGREECDKNCQSGTLNAARADGHAIPCSLGLLLLTPRFQISGCLLDQSFFLRK